MRLKEKVAITTGASQGIGRVYVRRLAEEGATVVLTDINEEKGHRLEEELGETGYRAKFIKVDVSDKESVGHMVHTVVEEFGTIDILINNAAIFSKLKMKPFEEISLDE